ncbi:MOSC domain-containing protein [Paraphoma chrysanthemicola]|nr:MOSC domain-containing protein [Paraphoma chrysanthemicola]
MSSAWDKERKFEIEKVSPVYLITALCVVPFGVYFLLNFLSPLIHRITAMKISEIYVYPVKSLRGVKVTEALGTPQGFKHDRTFMLIKSTPEGPKNMAVSREPEMTQFLQEIHGYNDPDGSLRITFRAYGDKSKESSITVPLLPDVSKLESYEVTMHGSPTPAFRMPQSYNEWFTSCFGYDVTFIYLGANTRAVLFQDMQPIEPDPLTRFLRDKIPFTRNYVDSLMGLTQSTQWRISFADCAPYLIVSQTSLDDVSSRLPEGTEMDVEKFRPNIVIKGAFEAYQEDYWGKVTINNDVEITMAHNCVRCKSINIDYETGKPGVGPSGDVLKKLQKDRRIDIGAKWSPVFGRYSFWDKRKGPKVVKVGDRVNVKKVNDGLTIWSWPGLA